MNQPPTANPAQVYEQYFVPAMFAPWATLLLRHAALEPGERVLDVACGTGVVARHAAPQVGNKGKVVGLDMNPAMLAVARSLPPPQGAHIEWQDGNAQALPFGDGSFDAALCQHGLQFFPDRLQAVREMRRVLAPDGRAVAIVLQGLDRHPVFQALMESVSRHFALPLAAVSTPFALCDADELRGLFSGAGFAGVDIRPETTTVRFADPQRFVPLAATSSAAAVPAFAQLENNARSALFDKVRADVDPVIARYRSEDALTFPMFAHVAIARRA
ncbi:MAG: Methyltransferase type 11 [Ramlibacter sp.]|jgi:ubiquinone/menaquinone biosynthesis C-methylase UbiE|nr:Methyltransferase type 11 [Ramlibacter sp.]